MVDTAVDLIGQDRSRVGVAFFSISEGNLTEQLRHPWVSICSDGSSVAPEGVSLESPTHPRAYGSFARVLRKYVREDHVLTLAEAVDRMTRLPAANFGLSGRGRLEEGMYADVVVPTTRNPARRRPRVVSGPNVVDAGRSRHGCARAGGRGPRAVVAGDEPGLLGGLHPGRPRSWRERRGVAHDLPGRVRLAPGQGRRDAGRLDGTGPGRGGG